MDSNGEKIHTRQRSLLTGEKVADLTFNFGSAPTSGRPRKPRRKSRVIPVSSSSEDTDQDATPTRDVSASSTPLTVVKAPSQRKYQGALAVGEQRAEFLRLKLHARALRTKEIEIKLEKLETAIRMKTLRAALPDADCSGMDDSCSADSDNPESTTDSRNPVHPPPGIAINLSNVPPVSHTKSHPIEVLQASPCVVAESQTVLSEVAKLLATQNEVFTAALFKVTSSGSEVRAESHDNTDTDLKQLIRRQSMGKLPVFSGRTEEWPLFISEFLRTTKMCGLTDEENMGRLRVSLTGDARDAVHAMLGIPGNVDEVIQTLEETFGRANQIIEDLIDKAKRTANPKDGRPEMLIAFSNVVRNTVRTIQMLGYEVHMNNPHLLNKFASKLPFNMQMSWNLAVVEHNVDPDLSFFSKWLQKHARAAGLIKVPKRSSSPSQIAKPLFPVFTDQKTLDPAHSQCQLCHHTGHSLEDCKQFLELAIDAKWEKVKSCKLCFKCLRYGHQVGVCSSKRRCGERGCTRSHHALLHRDVVHSSSPVQTVSHHSTHTSDVLLRILPVRVQGPAGEIDTFAFLDEGSTITLIDAAFSEKLGLSGTNDPLCIQWTGDVTQEVSDSKRVCFTITGTHQAAKPFSVVGARTISSLSLPHQTVDMEELKRAYPHLSTVPFSSYTQEQPTILIGQDNIALSTARKVCQGPVTTPVATKTLLGWVVHGNLSLPGRVDSQFAFHLCNQDIGSEFNLDALVKANFSTEAFGVKVVDEKCRSRQDLHACDILESTTRRIGPRFETGLLWRSPDVCLPESYSNAMNRLRCLEKKMDRDPSFAVEYSAKVQEFLDKGYARRLTREESATCGPRTWYLPHFPHFNPNKPGKLRFIADCAAESHGVSLNSALLTGPDLLRPLPAVLFKFRQGRVAVLGDIKEMFPQVRILQADQDSQRFLWRGMDRTRKPDVYVFESMVFGATCSPTSAIFTKDKNALEFEDEFPEAVNVILHHHYMDDMLYSTASEDAAIGLIRDVTEVYRRGGFHMCNWSSNSKAVITSVDPSDRAKSLIDLSLDEGLPMERVLGLFWSAESDEFTFTLKFNKVDAGIVSGAKHPTKRDVLKVVMSVFDPLGFLMSFTVKGRVLLQRIWKTGIGWDDELPTEVYQFWVRWLAELQMLPLVRIPRWYSSLLEEADDVQLHTFCDASSEAFAAVCYFRICSQANIHCVFVMSRARVAPTKTLSIPRLELQAALLGSRLASTVLAEHLTVPIRKSFFWSDSKTVLSWIRSDSGRYKQFVAHRIGEITELTNVADWHWVPTTDNVADDATRTDHPYDFSATSRWWSGPKFLLSPGGEWPTESGQVMVTEEELRKSQFVGAHIQRPTTIIPNVAYFSSLKRLLNATATLAKCAKKWLSCLGRIPFTWKKHSVADLEDAEMLLIKDSQMKSFPDEIQSLRKLRTISTYSKLNSLSPILDQTGVMRLTGRLDVEGGLAVDFRRPIILDPHEAYTKLLINDFHKRMLHQGQETVVNELRQRFWILNARSAVRKACFRCQWCKVKKSKPAVPEMGLLPSFRVKDRVLPFSCTGMDLFGPIEVVRDNKLLKCYGVIFTCLVTRAVHLELVSDLSSDACIMAIRRFISRRGQVKEIYTDNGTNFVGANSEINSSVENSNRLNVTGDLKIEGIKWHFIPPGTPHMGGCWERLIRSVKTALGAALSTLQLNDEILRTVFAEIEYVINNRPLTHVSVDPDDPESLTPNHFLLGGPSSDRGFGGSNELKRGWIKAQKATDMFWRRWIREYLPTLTRRSKWLKGVISVKIGNIVVIADHRAPRNSWPLGRVVATYPGRDGKIRVVDVRTSFGTFRRSVASICVLDSKDTEDEEK